MWYLVIFLCGLGSLHFVMGISLLDKKWNMVLSIFILALFPLFYHFFALKTNLGVLIKQLNNIGFVSNLVALEIANLLLTTYYSAYIIRSHYNVYGNSIRKFFSLFPSIFFMVGIILLQLWTFNSISSIPYIWLSLSLSFSIFVVLLIFVLLFRYGLKDWSLRLELKILLSLFLIMGAMLLPIFFQQISIVNLGKSSVNLTESAKIIGLAVLVAFFGFLNYKFRISLKIWRHFIKS